MQIAVFHSVLGVRPGILDAADRLRAAGHDVLIVDQYDGRVFDGVPEAHEFVESVGSYPALMQRAVEGVSELADGFACIGFSNGGGMSEYVASLRAVSRVVMCSGALPLDFINVPTWPAGVAAQIHYMLNDPLRQPGSADSVAASVRAAGAAADVFEYPGDGHLFTDPSLPDEYDADATQLFWQRVLDFVA